MHQNNFNHISVILEDDDVKKAIESYTYNWKILYKRKNPHHQQEKTKWKNFWLKGKKIETLPWCLEWLLEPLALLWYVYGGGHVLKIKSKESLPCVACNFTVLNHVFCLFIYNLHHFHHHSIFNKYLYLTYHMIFDKDFQYFHSIFSCQYTVCLLKSWQILHSWMES